MISVTRLNHAVLFVRELERSVAFYEQVLGLKLIARERGAMAFLRAEGSGNHHDLGLCAVGAGAPSPPPGAVGLYHLAWQVGRIEDLAVVRDELIAHGALTGTSDHGASKSVYGVDPDGNEFEVGWFLPRELWETEYDHRAPTRPLDLEREIARFAEQPGGR